MAKLHHQFGHTISWIPLLAIGVYNNKKTAFDEKTELLIDNVEVSASFPPPIPPTAQDDNLTTVEDTPVTFNVLDDNGFGPDSGIVRPLAPSTTTVLSPPTNGTLINLGSGLVPLRA